jgi:glycosyltransferase involved in cell wall biosynthesis
MSKMTLRPQKQLIHPKKRVLIVIGTLAIGGGAEKVAATLGSELVTRGHEVHLLTFYEAEQKYVFTGNYHTLGEPLIFNRLKKIWRIPKRVAAIRRYARAHDVDVALAFLEEANFYTLLAKLTGLVSLPVIVSVRNNIEKREWPFKIMTRLLYPFAKKVVSVTRSIEEALKYTYKLTNTTTIYNPLDLGLIETKKVVSLPSEYQRFFGVRPVCISIGRLTHQKGQWHLIRAFTAVKEKLPTASLVLLGEGEYEKQLLALITDCDLKGSVHLLGKHENVYRFLAAADVFVFSSLWEGMPNTMLEALAVGLPIISPDCVSGPREIIAPTVSVRDALNYPYKTANGILTSPLTDEVIWEAPDRVPLTSGERELADAIIIELQSVQSNGDRLSDSDSLASYRLESVVTAWENLL